MRRDAYIAVVVMLCCVLRWQPCSAHDGDTGTAALHQHRRLQGSQPSTAQAAHERTAGLAQQLRKLAARRKRSKPGGPQSAGGRRPGKPHGGHKHPHASLKPAPRPMPAPRKLSKQQKRPSRPTHSQRQPKPHVHVPPPALKLTASVGAASMNSTVIKQRACGAVVDSDDVKQEVQSRLLPTIGQLEQQGRIATVYINVYFSINRVGGAPLVASP